MRDQKKTYKTVSERPKKLTKQSVIDQRSLQNSQRESKEAYKTVSLTASTKQQRRVSSFSHPRPEVDQATENKGRVTSHFSDSRGEREDPAAAH